MIVRVPHLAVRFPEGTVFSRFSLTPFGCFKFNFTEKPVSEGPNCWCLIELTHIVTSDVFYTHLAVWRVSRVCVAAQQA